MTDNWINTESDGDAQRRADEFWAGMRTDIDAGQFWADRIKEYRGEPAKRLSLALQNLPLPGAFREAAVAVRALIRTKRKSKKPFEEELTLLYWLAAINSFMLDYACRLEEPGFNVVQSIPGKRLNSLHYKYSQLGYRDLSLLNKADAKWLAAAWGEPACHSTLNILHKDVWDEYETKLIEKRKQSDLKFRADLESLLSTTNTPPTPKTIQRKTPPKSMRSGCGIILAIITGGTWWLSY